MTRPTLAATLAALALGAGAFVAGLFWADGTPVHDDTAPAQAAPSRPAGPATAEPTPPPETNPQRSRVARLLEAGRLEAAVRAYNAIAGDAAAKARERRRILQTARALAADGRRGEAITLLRAFTRINHRDLRALLALAELHRLTGDTGAALEVLFQAGNAAHAAYGRERVDEVERILRATVRERANTLTQRSERAGLIALYRKLIRRGYARPEDRLALAVHLKEAGRYREAKRALAVVRGVPAIAEQAEALARRIDAAMQDDRGPRQRHRIALEQRGEHFTLRASAVGGGALELLVDTGASLVTVDRGAARRTGLDRRPTLGRRPLETANGVVEARIVQARGLRIGSLRIARIPIAILDEGLDGIDGLLGMSALRGYDVRLDRDAPALTLVPRDQ